MQQNNDHIIRIHRDNNQSPEDPRIRQLSNASTNTDNLTIPIDSNNSFSVLDIETSSFNIDQEVEPSQSNPQSPADTHPFPPSGVAPSKRSGSSVTSFNFKQSSNSISHSLSGDQSTQNNSQFSRPQPLASILDQNVFTRIPTNSGENISLAGFSDQSSQIIADSTQNFTEQSFDVDITDTDNESRQRLGVNSSSNNSRIREYNSYDSYPSSSHGITATPRNSQSLSNTNSRSQRIRNLTFLNNRPFSIDGIKEKLRNRRNNFHSAVRLPRFSSNARNHNQLNDNDSSSSFQHNGSNKNPNETLNHSLQTDELSDQEIIIDDDDYDYDDNDDNDEEYDNRNKHRKTHFNTNKANHNTTTNGDENNEDIQRSHEQQPSKYKRRTQIKKSLNNKFQNRRWRKFINGDAFSHEEDQQNSIPSDSRYPEVRASVPNTDNFDLPQNTLRMWTIGIIMTTLGCAINTIFFLHSPLFVISTFVASMIAWPIGKLWERFVPNKTIFGIPLNPAPFNLKEHALITIMAGVSFGDGAAYMTDIVLTLRHFYDIDFGWGFNIMGIICTQAIGYSIAGIVRRILVYPASMIWPNTLVTTTFLTNIHLNVNHVTNGWHISRLRLFMVVMILCSFWSWIPSFFAPILSDFGVLTWITPQNVVINQLFGTRNGLGLFPITFDWSQIAGYIGSPLIPPFFAIGNIFASIVIVFWIATPIIHYSNVWFGNYLPISSYNTYDRYQNVYDVTRILTPNKVFDLEKYQNYSPMFLPTTFAVAYGMSFASISSTVVHTILFHGKEILFFWRHSRNEPDDIHMHLMKRYREAPDWWYWVSLSVFLSMAIVLVKVWDTDMPVWALFFSLAIAGLMLVPIGMIYALTNISVGLNVITEFIVGYLVPGRPIAMMLFKTFGYITNYQAIKFLSGMKLGHYMKISPRIMFAAQLVATIWGGVVQLAALYWAENNIVDICSPFQSSSFTCSAAHVFFNASVIWGVVGPQRQLSVGQLYNKTLYFFLVGGLLPLFTWLFLKKYPKSPLRYIHWPVFFTGTGYIPPATPYTYGAYCIVGYIFGFWIKRRYFGWWAKYNYTLSAGLDLGLAWTSLVIFLITLSPSVIAPSWWGTKVITRTADYFATPMIQLEKGKTFGPETW